MPGFTQDEFIQIAVEKWGQKYDYSLVKYKNMRTKVTIGCEIHGVFDF
jgi:hypothetical protein